MATSETSLDQLEIEAWLQPGSIQEVKDWWANEETRGAALDFVPLLVLKRLNLVP